MDFDDLDDTETAMGPTPLEIRDELLAKQIPGEMPGACRHPAPLQKGALGTGAKHKVLYLHGPGSNEKMAERQTLAAFKALQVVEPKLFEWKYHIGTINQKVEEIHADPAVAQVFIPFGNKCGDTYDGYMSYTWMHTESHQTETWYGEQERVEHMKTQTFPDADKSGYEQVMDDLAKYLKENGPFNGICGFDMGACIAFDAARLAQEDDPRFKNQFGYMLIFSGRGHRELAQQRQGTMRPKAPLQIPTFLMWSQEDDSKQYGAYEDLALYIHPDYRAVVLHDQGHRPPNIQKSTSQVEQLNGWMGQMEHGSDYKVKDTEDVLKYKNFWLPLLREPLAEVNASAPLILVVLHDPLGQHGPRKEDIKTMEDVLKFPAQEHPDQRNMRLDSYQFVTGTKASDFKSGSNVEILEVEYPEAYTKLDWHPKVEARDVSMAYAAGQGRSRWLQAEDEVTVPWDEVRRMAGELLEKLSFIRGDNVCLVGVGTGAHVAFALAEQMIRQRSMEPARLFTISPPTVWPSEGIPELGSLCTTPIRYLTCPASVASPPWRLETATFGPFSHSHFADKASMLKLVMDEVEDLSKFPCL